MLHGERDQERHGNYNNKTTFALMALSWLAGVSNFCSYSLLPFLSIICILSSQAISFQILFYALFISTSITSRIWELMSPRMTYDHTTADGFELSYPQPLQQRLPYHKKHQLTPYQPVSHHTS